VNDNLSELVNNHLSIIYQLVIDNDASAGLDPVEVVLNPGVAVGVTRQAAGAGPERGDAAGDRLAVLHPRQRAAGVTAADAVTSGRVHADHVFSDHGIAIVGSALGVVQNREGHLVEDIGDRSEDIVVDLAPAGCSHHVSFLESGRTTGRQADGCDGVCKLKRGAQMDESQVIVEEVRVPVRVFEEVSGHLTHLRCFRPIDVLGSSDNFNAPVSRGAMGGGEHPFRADDGAAAEVHVVNEHANLPWELVGRGLLSSDDLVSENWSAILNCLVTRNANARREGGPSNGFEGQSLDVGGDRRVERDVLFLLLYSGAASSRSCQEKKSSC